MDVNIFQFQPTNKHIRRGREVFLILKTPFRQINFQRTILISLYLFIAFFPSRPFLGNLYKSREN